jgi:hypothetical protein
VTTTSYTEETLGRTQSVGSSEAEQRALLAEEEVAALRQQLIVLKDYCDKERKTNQQHRLKIEQLTAELEQAQQRGTEFPLSERRQRSNDLSSERPASTQDKENVQALKENNAALSRALADNQRHSKQLERVIHFLRERSEEVSLEANQLREEFQASQQQVALLMEQHKTAQKEAHLITQQLTAQQASQEDAISQQKHVIALLNAELATLRQEKRQMEESLVSTKTTHDEKDLNLKIAQQHLAKKMKELTLLSEKVEEQKIQILELQQCQLEAQSQLASMQKATETQIQREKQAQEQLKESITAGEEHIKKWETKYFQIYEKWQQVEGENKALRLLEDKQHQMQTLLGNLNHLIGSSPLNPPKTQIAEQNQLFPSDSKYTPTKQPEQVLQRNYNDLFDSPEPSPQYKQSLFD